MKTPISTTRASLAATSARHSRWLARLLAGTSTLASPALATVWSGATSSDWNVNTNWVGNSGTVGTPAQINTITPNVATLSGNPPGNPTTIIIANGSTAIGRLNHHAGTISTAAGNDIQIGRAGGTGTYHLANTAGTGGTLTAFGQGSGSTTALRHVYVGGFTSGAAATGTLNLHTTGTLAISNQLLIGNATGTGTVKMDSGTLTVGDAFEVGNGPGTTGTFSMSGGTVTKSGATAVTIGGGLAADGGTGTANLNGGIFTSAGVFRVGQDTITASATVSTGTLNLGGTQLTVNGEFWIGNNTGASGTLNFSSGSLVTNNWALIGRKDEANTGVGATGTVTMSGGTWTKTGDSNFIVGDTGNGTMTMSGGTVTVVPSNVADRGITWIANRNNCSGLLTLSGSADFRSPRIVLAVQAGTTGTLVLDGGSLRTSQILGGIGTSAVTFNGTQIIATGDSASFINQLGTATLGTGGLRVDSAGFTLTAPQAFAGTGNVVKSGPGTLTLTGPSTHGGDHLVTAGKLAFSTAFAGTGEVTVANGAALGAIQNDPDLSVTLQDLTLGSSGATSLDLDLGNFPGNPTAPALKVTGTLTLNGPVTVNIADPQVAAGKFDLITYTAPKAGAGSFVLGDLPDGVSATLLDDGNGLVTLTIGTISLPQWSGATNGVWDRVTGNWTDFLTSLPVLYADLAPVVFNDAAAANTAITLNETVAPASVTFAGFTNVYTLNGSGKITGDTGLTKTSSTDLTINTANDFTGPTVLSGGTTFINRVADAGSPSSLGAAPAAPSNLVLSGGSLTYTGPDATSNRGFAVNAAATTITTDSALTFGGPVTSNAGNLVKRGTGNLTLSHNGANVLGTVANGVLVHAGTLTLRGTGAQTHSVAGEMWVADLPDSPADLVLDTTTLTTGSWLAIGRGNGNDGVTRLTATGSTLNTANFSTGFNNGLADNASEAFVTLVDTVWNNNGLTYLAESTGSAATMILRGNSKYNITNNFLLARFAGTNATFTLSDTSSVTKTGGYSAIGNEGVAVMNVGDNASFTATTGDFNIGDVGSSNGTLNLSGAGAVNVANVYIGKNISTAGTLNQTGGSFQSGTFITIGAFNGCTGVVNISAGSLVAATVLTVGQSGAGTLNLSGSASASANGDGVFVGSVVGGLGTLNLNGGTLTTKRLAGVSGGSGRVNFNGGLLKAAAGANADFVSGINNATLLAGGALIDTSGQTLTASATLGGSGGLTKSGSGTLVLSGTNTYTGPTTVSAGTLSLATPFLADSAALTIAAGAVLNLPHGATDVVASLTIGNAPPLAPNTYDSTTHPGIITGTGKIQVSGAAASAYDTWASGFGLNPLTDGAPGFDKDQDGQSNGVEFALGGSPVSGSNNAKVYSLLADSSDPGSARELLMTLAVRGGTPAFAGSPSPTATRDGVTYLIQGSANLATFTSPVSAVAPVTTGLPAAPAGYEYRTFRLDASDGLPAKGFLRVNVTP
jgi:autotransporter-associated beta strand protein